MLENKDLAALRALMKNGGGGSGGGTSIDVTAEVGQTIVVEEVDANGKPTKWKSADYQPRTHWSETGITEILPETTITIDPETGVGSYAESIGLTAGNNYTVRWNGTEHNCTAQDFYTPIDEEGNMAKVGVVLGNVDLMQGGAGTGEPFIVMEASPEFAAEMGVPVVINALDGSESVVLSIVGEGEIIHTIPSKYVPYALPYYIEVTGSGTEDDPYVCAETVENVEAIYRSGRSMVARHTMTQETEHAGGVDRNTTLAHYYITTVLDSSNIPQGLVFAFLQSVESPTVYDKQPMLYFLPQEDGTYAVSKSIG